MANTPDTTPPALDALAHGVTSHDRVALSKAITLIESSRPDHQEAAQSLLARLLPQSGGALRIGITGIPGVGKSTFINAFGELLCQGGHRVAVLAVDPTSSRTGGSIMGDKTRMPDLARNDRAFIRPSPTTGKLGGVARHSKETLLLCEAAGFDPILVETVGVGQSETAVADMVDFFLVLTMPGAGDELQGLKKGVLELADMIAVNKADGDLQAAAERTASQYRSALSVLAATDPDWSPPVVLSSGLNGDGLTEIWRQIGEFRRRMTASGAWKQKRQDQQIRWMWGLVDEALLRRVRDNAALTPLIARLTAAVVKNRVTPVSAAAQIIDGFLKDSAEKGS